MRKKKINKDIKKSITHSWGRFFSIMLLMALGSFALVGLSITGPDMRKTGENYFQTYNTADITVISDYGIDDSEVSKIETASNIKDIEYIYLKDVVENGSNTSFRLFSMPERISKYEVVQGKLPENEDEIAIDFTNAEKYKIGDTISFVEAEDTDDEETNKILKRTEFKIVGFINSPDILSTLNRGETTIGTGTLNCYGIINKNNFDSDVYMMAKIVFKDTAELDPYTEEYDNKILAHKKELEDLLEEQKNIRFTNIKSEYQEKIDEANQELNDAKQELADAKTALNDAKTKIEDAKQEISKNQKSLNNASTQIANAEKELNNGKVELESKKQELQTTKSTLEENQKALEEGKAQYENGIKELKENIEKINFVLQNPNLSEQEKAGYQQQLAILNQKLNETETAYKEFQENTYTQGVQQIKAGFAVIQEKESELKSAEETLANLQNELTSKKSEHNSGVKKLNNAKNELATKEAKYNEKLQEYEEKEPEANQKIADGEKEITEAQSKLDELEKPVYQVDNRREVPGGEGYEMYQTVSNIIDSLAKIFPLFMYFVAALVTLTTMTRFVDEERINMGTYKALGYKDKDIVKKFVVYGFLASFVGTAIGVGLGHFLIPFIAYNAYSAGFSIPTIKIHFYPKETLMACILSFICSVLPAYITAKNNLKEKPSDLLLPKAPTKGSKIFLERIKFIWNKMNFTHKVTARNIFRYKKRMLMTIFGVAGASALIFTGFSVQHSISTINDKQFQNIIKYDMIVALNDNLSQEEQTELDNLSISDDVSSKSSIYYESITKEAGSKNDKQEINLIVPENIEDFNNYIHLQNRKTKQTLELDDEGVIISERLATILNAKIGDEISFKDSKDNTREVKISGICEMYAGHFMFMGKATYEKVYNDTYQTNAYMFKLKDASIENTENVSAKFMELSAVKGVVQNTTLYNQINTIVNSLDKIMIVLIAVSAMLAIVILFNLTNINVEERIRELSTIKVLGFRDNEVTMYIYRETIILSQIGIAVGWLLGIWLHNYILTVVPPDQVMFDPQLWICAYIIPFAVINIVTLILKFYINRKLINVDMIEALKSVD